MQRDEEPARYGMIDFHDINYGASQVDLLNQFAPPPQDDSDPGAGRERRSRQRSREPSRRSRSRERRRSKKSKKAQKRTTSVPPDRRFRSARPRVESDHQDAESQGAEFADSSKDEEDNDASVLAGDDEESRAARRRRRRERRRRRRREIERARAGDTTTGTSAGNDTQGDEPYGRARLRSAEARKRALRSLMSEESGPGPNEERWTPRGGEPSEGEALDPERRGSGLKIAGFEEAVRKAEQEAAGLDAAEIASRARNALGTDGDDDPRLDYTEFEVRLIKAKQRKKNFARGPKTKETPLGFVDNDPNVRTLSELREQIMNELDHLRPFVFVEASDLYRLATVEQVFEPELGINSVVASLGIIRLRFVDEVNKSGAGDYASGSPSHNTPRDFRESARSVDPTSFVERHAADEESHYYADGAVTAVTQDDDDDDDDDEIVMNVHQQVDFQAEYAYDQQRMQEQQLEQQQLDEQYAMEDEEEEERQYRQVQGQGLAAPPLPPNPPRGNSMYQNVEMTALHDEPVSESRGSESRLERTPSWTQVVAAQAERDMRTRQEQLRHRMTNGRLKERHPDGRRRTSRNQRRMSLAQYNAMESHAEIQDVQDDLQDMASPDAPLFPPEMLEARLERIRKTFNEIEHDLVELDYATFVRVFGMKSRDFLPRAVFNMLAGRTKTLPVQRFQAALQRLVTGSWRDFIRFLFRLTDTNGDGKMSMAELRVLLSLRVSDADVGLDPAVYVRLCEQLYYEFYFRGGSVFIGADEFAESLLRKPTILQGLLSSVISTFPISLPGEVVEFKWYAHHQTVRDRLNYFCHRDSNWLLTVCLYAVVMVLVAASRCYEMVEDEVPFPLAVARVAGTLLNVNVALLVLLAQRRVLRFFKDSSIGVYLPLDNVEGFQRAISFVILVLSSLHAAGRVVQFTRDHDEGVGEYIFGTELSGGWIADLAGITGFALVCLVLLLNLVSLPVWERRGYFGAQHLARNLFYLLAVALFVHARDFWKFAVPVAFIFAIEKFVNWVARPTRTLVVRDVILPNKVTMLQLRRPPHFEFKPGQYVTVRFPTINIHQWRSFVITSPPEELNFITLHVRSVDTWTRHVHDAIRGRQVRRKRAFKASLRTIVAGKQDAVEPTPAPKNKRQLYQVVREAENLKVDVTGPHGLTITGLQRAEHAVLIAVGTNVVQFASLLRSLWAEHRLRFHTCPSCRFHWQSEAFVPLTRPEVPTQALHTNEALADDGSRSNLLASDDVEPLLPPEPEVATGLRKVDFFWVTPGLRTLTWVLDMLQTMERDPEYFNAFNSFMHFHIYVTGAKTRDDIKGMTLDATLDRAGKAINDPADVLRHRTHPGRPNWDVIFERLDRAGSATTVYYVGPDRVATAIERRASARRFDFRRWE